MFYSQDILQRQSGKFGIIWLAATAKFLKLTRREIQGVDIERTCDRITAHIIHRRKDKQRFSLYLSSKLMYGCVRVYRRKADYLLEDAAAALAHVRLYVTSKEDIDIKTPRPELVTNLDVTKRIILDDFGKFDAFEEELYGTSFDIAALSSPEVLRMSASFVHSPTTRPPRTSVHISPILPDRTITRTVTGSPHTVPNEQITLREPAASTTTESTLVQSMGQELPPADDKFLEMIAQTMDVPSKLDDLSTPGKKTSEPIISPVMVKLQFGEKTGLLEAHETVGLPLSPKEKTPRAPPPPPSDVRPEKRKRLLPVTETPVPVPGSDTVTAAPQVLPAPLMKPSLPLELSPIATRDHRRPAKRRHIMFFDQRTQISKAMFAKQIQNTQDIVQPNVIPMPRKMINQDFFIRPALKDLASHEKLLPLWKRNAFSRFNARLDLSSECLISEETARDIGTEEEREGRRGSKQKSTDADRMQFDLPQDTSLRESLTSGQTLEEQTEKQRRRKRKSADEKRQKQDLSTREPEEREQGAKQKSLDGDRTQVTPPEILREQQAEQSKQMSLHEESLELPRDADISRSRSILASTPLDKSGRSLQESLLKSVSLDESVGSKRRRRTDSSEAIPTLGRISPTRLQFDVDLGPVPEETSIRSVPPSIRSDDPNSFYRNACERLMAAVESATEELTTFKDICPLTSSRSSAVIHFGALLDLCKLGELSASQSEMYGEIFISLGHPRNIRGS